MIFGVDAYQLQPILLARSLFVNDRISACALVGCWRTAMLIKCRPPMSKKESIPPLPHRQMKFECETSNIATGRNAALSSIRLRIVGSANLETVLSPANALICFPTRKAASGWLGAVIDY